MRSQCAIQREVESAGAVCSYDNAGDKVRGNTGNLIAKIPGNIAGTPPFLLAAHMDTVAPGEGVKPIVEGDIIRTDGSTVLGGDDKSGCAVICEVLHRLRESGIPHGPIDAVFTICEEIGLQGARNLDLGADFRQGRTGVRQRRAGPSGRARAERGFDSLHGEGARSPCGRGAGARSLGDQDRAEAIAAMRLGRIDDETTANLGVIEGGRAGNVIPSGSGRARRSAVAQRGQAARPDRSYDRVLHGSGRARECDGLTASVSRRRSNTRCIVNTTGWIFPTTRRW